MYLGMSTSRARSLKRNLGGFTLIEIVVATFIMAVFTVLVLSVSTGVLDIWRNAAGRVESTRESRLVLSAVETDFESIVFENKGQTLYYEVNNDLAGSFYPQNTARIILITSTLDAPDVDPDGVESPGDICAIKYELNHLPIFTALSADRDRVFSLYRGVVDPRTTFNDFIQQDDISAVWDGVNIIYSTQNRRNIFASNVVDFTAVFYASDPADSNAIAAVPVNDNLYVSGGQLYVDGSESDLVLEYVDFEFAFLSAEGATTLQRHIFDGETIYANLDEIIEEYGQTFSRRVPIVGGL